MLRHITLPAILCLAAIAIAGCSKSDSPVAVVDPRYLLPSEPVKPISVLDFKGSAKAGETVSVTGRVGGGIKPWIEGRAAFLLVDNAAPWPSPDDKCGPDCPHCAAELAASTTVVKFLDDQGKTIAIDARQLLGLKEEETVVVNGVAKRDDDGNVALMASGIFIKR